MSSRAPARVAVLNDYDIVVAGVVKMLEPHSDRVAVVEASTGPPTTGAADVVLYDTFSQAQGNALDVGVCEAKPDVPTVGDELGACRPSYR